MRLSKWRITGITALVLIQLFMVPATHLLHCHCDCEHALSNPLARSAETRATAKTASSPTTAQKKSQHDPCRNSCCDHKHRTDTASMSLSNSQRAKSPHHTPDRPARHHDPDNCSVCRTVFAARIATEVVGLSCLPQAYIRLQTPPMICVQLQPMYRLPSRGPPLTVKSDSAIASLSGKQCRDY